ncbi:MAG: hypothetical protein AAGM36_18005 [Cyanobacteria bacterium J06597_1]
MTAIPIELSSSQLQPHITELNISSNGIFSGSGISLNVWKKLFNFDDSSWYGTTYGGDAAGFIAISAPHISSPQKQLVLASERQDADNVSINIAGSGISALTHVELSQCEFKDAERFDLEAIDRDRNIRNWISTQDDFSFAFPARANPLCDAIRIVLGVHQYFLGVDIAEGKEIELAEHLEYLLSRYSNIQVFSDPERKEISVTFGFISSQFFKRLFGIEDSVTQVLYSHYLHG